MRTKSSIKFWLVKAASAVEPLVKLERKEIKIYLSNNIHDDD